MLFPDGLAESSDAHRTPTPFQRPPAFLSESPRSTPPPPDDFNDEVITTISPSTRRPRKQRTKPPTSQVSISEPSFLVEQTSTETDSPISFDLQPHYPEESTPKPEFTLSIPPAPTSLERVDETELEPQRGNGDFRSTSGFQFPPPSTRRQPSDVSISRIPPISISSRPGTSSSFHHQNAHSLDEPPSISLGLPSPNGMLRTRSATTPPLTAAIDGEFPPHRPLGSTAKRPYEFPPQQTHLGTPGLKDVLKVRFYWIRYRRALIGLDPIAVFRAPDWDGRSSASIAFCGDHTTAVSTFEQPSEPFR